MMVNSKRNPRGLRAQMLQPLSRWVATHTCASLLITTERSFNKSHELPILDADARQTMSHAASAFCNSNLHRFFLLFCSMRPPRLYLAYTMSFNVLLFFELYSMSKLLLYPSNIENTRKSYKRIMEEPKSTNTMKMS